MFRVDDMVGQAGKLDQVLEELKKKYNKFESDSLKKAALARFIGECCLAKAGVLGNVDERKNFFTEATKYFNDANIILARVKMKEPYIANSVAYWSGLREAASGLVSILSQYNKLIGKIVEAFLSVVLKGYKNGYGEYVHWANIVNNGNGSLRFKGIILSYSKKPGNITLHWGKAFASNGVTVSGYRIRIRALQVGVARVGAGGEGAEPFERYISSEEFSFSGDGFVAGGTYSCLVTAIGNGNIDGNIESANTRVTEVTVLESDLECVEGVEVNNNNVSKEMRERSMAGIIQNGVVGSRALLASLMDGDMICDNWGSAEILRRVDGGDGFGIRESLSLHKSYEDAMEVKEDGFENSVSFGAGLDLGYSFGFEPEFQTEVVFEEGYVWGSFKRVKLSAKGIFRFEAKASLNLQTNYSFLKTQSLFTRTMTLYYTIGGVPVLQDIILELMAELDVESNAKIESSVTLSAFEELEFGFEYDAKKGTTPISGGEFDSRVDFVFQAAGQLSGTLKVFPVVSTRFYKAATANLKVIPSIELNVDSSCDGGNVVTLERFDLDGRLDVACGAELKIFGLRLAGIDGGPWKVWSRGLLNLTDRKVDIGKVLSNR